MKKPLLLLLFICFFISCKKDIVYIDCPINKNKDTNKTIFNDILELKKRKILIQDSILKTSETLIKTLDQ